MQTQVILEGNTLTHGEGAEIQKIIIQNFPSLRKDLILRHKKASSKQEVFLSTHRYIQVKCQTKFYDL